MAMEIYTRKSVLLEGDYLHKDGPEGQWRTNISGISGWLSSLTLKLRVGRGDKVLFWKEDYSGHGTLQSLFPGLFSISLNTGCNIQEMLSPQGWKLTFRRLLNDWEIPWVAKLLNLIGNFRGRLCWVSHDKINYFFKQTQKFEGIIN